MSFIQSNQICIIGFLCSIQGQLYRLNLYGLTMISILKIIILLKPYNIDGTCIATIIFPIRSFKKTFPKSIRNILLFYIRIILITTSKPKAFSNLRIVIIPLLSLFKFDSNPIRHNWLVFVWQCAAFSIKRFLFAQKLFI